MSVYSAHDIDQLIDHEMLDGVQLPFSLLDPDPFLLRAARLRQSGLAVLIRSAHSANIKERRDASTALFDAGGQMIMQAEHIPVHLGAMPAAVAAVAGESQAPGRSWIVHDP